LYELNEISKTVYIVDKTITIRSDGYFELSTPKNDVKYTIGIRIEQAENCPEKFKHAKEEPGNKMEKKTQIQSLINKIMTTFNNRLNYSIKKSNTFKY
jgi:hypothetical protein